MTIKEQVSLRVNRITRAAAALVVGVFTLAAGCSAAPEPELYAKTIAAPKKMADGLFQRNGAEAAVSDLQSTLQEMTGEKFSVAPEYSGAGISIIHTGSPQAPAEAVAQLKGKGREAFVIRSDDKDKLWIVANSDDGLSHGIYFYLEQLGVRFYFPNPNWTVIPRRSDITLKINRLVAPAFKQRGFFGTGGFSQAWPIDPEVKMKDRWLDWQRRNRFGGEFTTGGHTGELFNKQNKEILLKNPDYLAGGKWHLSAKLNTANADAVQLYIDWSLERMRQARQKNPDAFAVSVDPADGGGHCETEACKQIGSGSVSDQVFYVANQVAKAVAKEFPGGHVSLYAYNQHADVPTIPLEKNIYVLLAPYAFQRTDMTPEELIQAWGRKVPQMGIREYWSITDWTKDLPTFDYRNTPAQKLRFWHENQVIGVAVESTYSAGAMGPGWYVASRLMWNPDQPVEPLLNEFYDDVFGAARPPMQRMLERWAASFRLDSQELALSFRDMQEAMKLAGDDEAVLARLDDYGKYLQFLRLFHEFGLDKEDTEEARLALLRHLWSIYPSAMVHTRRHTDFLKAPWPKWREWYQTNFDPNDTSAKGWEGVGRRSHQDVMQWISDGAEQYQPLGFRARSYNGPLVRLVKAPMVGEPKWSSTMMFAGSTEFELEAAPEVLRFPLRVSSLKGTTEIKVLDENGKAVFTGKVASSPAWLRDLDEVVVTVPQPGRYRVRLENRGNSINLQAPSNVALSWRSFLTNKGGPSPRIYFYVPAGLKAVALSDPSALGTRFFNADGEPVTPSSYDNGQLLILLVPPGQDGKVWSMEYVRTPNNPLQMLNVPQVFSFFPHTLLVPQDASP